MKIAVFKELTRFEQTLFGLPYILAGALLPLTQGEVAFSLKWFWVLPAFFSARLSGMAFNQLIDRYIDAKNPRTENRVLPSHRASAKQARVIAWGGLFLFLYICSQINTLCFFFAPFAAFLLYMYSYLKRMTAGCHFVLGGIHFLGPVMAAAAVSGSLSVSALFLGCAAACSIIGSDVVYAIQDLDFDRKEHLFSLPSRLGVEKSVSVARLMHLGCLFMLLGLGITACFPLFYYLLIPLVASTFYRFHKKVSHKIVEPLFFSCTVMTAILVFGFIFASFVWDVL